MASTIEKLAGWLATHRRVLEVVLRRVAECNLMIFPIREERGRDTLRRIRAIEREGRLLQSFHQAYHLYRLVQSTAKIPGDVAEVGVYRGGSAKVICEAKGDRRLHLFDTFEGLPPVEAVDRPWFREGEYRAPSVADVQAYLQDYPGVQIHAGLFPATASRVQGAVFSFVHLDVDLKKSTEACLDFFYPRMSPGGIILSQDYAFPGPRAAIEGFFADKPEPIIELWSTQCMIVKLA